MFLAQATDTGITADDLNTIEQNGLPGLRSEFSGSSATIGGIVNVVVPYVFVAAGFLLLLYIVYGGYTMMISQGDPKALAGAKGKITNAIIGFFILFLSYWIVQGVALALGLTQISDIF